MSSSVDYSDCQVRRALFPSTSLPFNWEDFCRYPRVILGVRHVLKRLQKRRFLRASLFFRDSCFSEILSLFPPHFSIVRLLHLFGAFCSSSKSPEPELTLSFVIPIVLGCFSRRGPADEKRKLSPLTSAVTFSLGKPSSDRPPWKCLFWDDDTVHPSPGVIMASGIV